MTVIRAILFYSKHDKKSYRMKTIIDSIGADIDTVSVDSIEIRDRLLEDDKYGIDQVPAVLVLYSTGQHKTYTLHHLDEWFEQLLQNIEQYHNQQFATQSPSQLDLMPDPEPEYTTIDVGVPKPIRRNPTESVFEIPTSLPAPGRPRHNPPEDGEFTILDTPNPPMGGGGISSAQAAMISEHIRGADPLIPITSDPHIQAGRKEVKKEGLSAAEMAKQMQEQREHYEEKLEEIRPFI